MACDADLGRRHHGERPMSQTVTRALRLLTELGEGERSLDQLAEVIGVHKTTVLRLLQSLEADRFVYRDADYRYHLGAGLFALSSLAMEQRGIRPTAAPHLAALNAATGQTVHLAAYEGGEVVYIDKYDSRHKVRMYSRIGLKAGLHNTAVAQGAARRPAGGGAAAGCGGDRLRAAHVRTPSCRRRSCLPSWKPLPRRGGRRTTPSTRRSSTASARRCGTRRDVRWPRCRSRCRTSCCRMSRSWNCCPNCWTPCAPSRPMPVPLDRVRRPLVPDFEP